MVENLCRPAADDVAGIYLGIVAAAASRPPAAVRAALSMAVVLIGEQHGFHGDALLDWIDTITATARLAAQTGTADRATSVGAMPN